MTKKLCYLFFAATMTFTSCVQDRDYFATTVEDTPKVFDFATVKNFQFNLDYALTNYAVQFEIYSENPFQSETITENGITYEHVVKKADLKPLYRAYTNSKGAFHTSAEGIVLPAYSKELYIFSDFPGVPTLLKANVNGSSITIAGTESTKSTRAGETTTNSVTSNAKSGKINLLPGYSWNAKTGRPSEEFMRAPITVDPTVLTSIHSTLKEGRNLKKFNPGLFNNSVIHVKTETEIDMVFIHAITGLHDAVGYYTYTGTTPPASLTDIHSTLIFPNCRYTGIEGDMKTGDNVRLKYFNPTTQQYQDKFPAGTNIGLFLCSGGCDYKNDNKVNANNGLGTYFTDKKFTFTNTKTEAKAEQMVVLYSELEKMAVVGIEDGWFNSTGCDKDFNDVVIGFKIPGIDPTDLPPIDPEDEDDPADNTLEYSGTLAFEDLWPSHGDFDMNDVVVKYRSVQYRNKENKVVQVVDSIWPVWSGATYNNGFGYQYGIPASAFSELSISTDYPKGLPTSFNIDHSNSNINGLEAGQNLATVMIFDNVNDNLTRSKNNPNAPIYLFRVSATLATPVEEWKIGTPPYNPFVVIRDKVDTDIRGKEVHLMGHAPTQLCNDSWFGTQFDATSQDNTLSLKDRNFYASKVLPEIGVPMPFAIQFPGEFTWPDEGQAIYTTYPAFLDWVKSNGLEHRDWWMK